MEEPRNGSRYVTWAQYGQDRERDRNVYVTQGDLAQTRDDITAHIVAIEKLANASTLRIDDVFRQLTAAPDGDKPGGLMWQMGEMRREQKALVRNLAIVVAAVTFLWNLVAPYVSGWLHALVGVPHP
ncbi:MAG TPA: hypothetical protein VFJ93_07795 [Gaiellaceae bacterium]|nr:hypothetical protein [Gaiellaceae bacterium]